MDHARPAIRDAPQLQLNQIAVSTVVPSWLVQVVQGYEKDPKTKELLQILATGSDHGAYSLINGVIRYKGRVWLGANTELQQTVLSALQDSAEGGHSGFPVTYQVCVSAATMHWRERGVQHFGWKLDKGDCGEHPRGVGSRAPLARGEGPRHSTELLDRGAWPSCGLPFA